jgi:hypothetical protein
MIRVIAHEDGGARRAGELCGPIRAIVGDHQEFDVLSGGESPAHGRVDDSFFVVRGDDDDCRYGGRIRVRAAKRRQTSEKLESEEGCHYDERRQDDDGNESEQIGLRAASGPAAYSAQSERSNSLILGQSGAFNDF